MLEGRLVMTRMDIELVTRSTPLHAGSGGMERVSWDLARSMNGRAGVSVSILTTPVPGRPPCFEHDGLTVRTVHGSRPGRYSMKWWVKTALRPPAAPVVFSAGGGATGMIWRRRRDTRYAFHAHGTSRVELAECLRTRAGRLLLLRAIRHLLWIGIDLVTYRRADVVLAASDQVTRNLRRLPYPAAWRKTPLITIPNGVDGPRFSVDGARRARARHDFGYSETDVVAVTISRLHRQKGVDRVIRALATAPESVTLLVVGDGPERGALETLASSIGVGSRVRFAGELDREHVVDALAAADAFVLPVRSVWREGMPLGVLEALAAGLPVIVPLESSWPANLAPSLTFSDVSSPERLSSTLSELATRHDCRSRLPEEYELSCLTDRTLAVLGR